MRRFEKNSDGEFAVLDYILDVLYGGPHSELATALLLRFGNIAGVFGAKYDELVRVDGITERVATFFSTMRPLCKQALLRAANGCGLKNERAAVDLAEMEFVGARGTANIIICYDCDGRAIDIARVADSDILRGISERVCACNARSVLWLHNNCNGEKEPKVFSPSRAQTVERVVRFSDIIDAQFIDYIECTGKGFFSLQRALSGDDGLHAVCQASRKTYTGGCSLSAIAEYRREF